VGRTDGRNPHQILRVDWEVKTPLSAALQGALAEHVEAVLPQCHGLLIADYGKGVCTPALLRQTLTTARRLGKPVLIDPVRGSDYTRYHGATLLKPNRSETAAATGVPVVSPEDALVAAERLCHCLALEMAVVTLDRDGMALHHRDLGGAHFPTTARAVYDITGAGDMVLAALGVFLCGGASPDAALQLANVAAGLEVEHVGVAAISRPQLRQRVQQAAPAAKIVDRDTAARLANEYRQTGKRTVLTNGCFDLLHAGHVLSLAAARAEGDVLFVGVNSDEVIRRLKGKQRPIISQHDRMAVLAALACVDHVILFHEETPHELLRAIRPDVLVKGGTYAPDQVVGREVVEAYGGAVRVTPIVDGLSTSHIVETVLQKSAA
jgi:D-beta-D-heptose 7-phosphate kinase/D-beta-D-heptose 1-phosphate adenosyltransferase